ncbi:MAG: PqiC family protein [Thermodesulfobacteriota bacterium]
MKAKAGWSIIIGTGFLAALLLAGCGAESPKVKFYTLSALPRTSNPASAGRNLTVGVGPINFPKLLNRPQIIARNGPNQVEIDEYHRWAGRLEDDFLRILAEDLGLILGAQRVALFPWEEAFKPTFRVWLDVHRFDGGPGRDLVLEATWSVARTGGQEAAVTKRSDIKISVSNATYEDLVAAHSRAVAALGREIGQAINGWR